MVIDKAPSTCAHQVVLSLCVAGCLALASWPRPVRTDPGIEATIIAHRIATRVLILGPLSPWAWGQLGTAASTRGSWPRRTVLSAKNPL